MSPRVPCAQNAGQVSRQDGAAMTDREPPRQAPSRDSTAGGTPSERDWLRVNSYLHANRHGLAVRAATAYPQASPYRGHPAALRARVAAARADPA